MGSGGAVPGADRTRLYKLAARELSMQERPEFIRNAVDVVLASLSSTDLEALLRARSRSVSAGGTTSAS